MLSSKAIEEYRSLYKKVYSKDLSVEEAKVQAEKLMELFMIIYKPIPIVTKSGVPRK